MKRAYYQSSIGEFLSEDPERVLGELARNHHFALDISQKNAWLAQIKNLKDQLAGFEFGEIFFEFSIPRMGKRADVLLLIGGIVFVLEYKAGAKTYERFQSDQALDYSLDLKNFHAGSHHKRIVPILISTKAHLQENIISWFPDGIAAPLLSNGENLSELIKQSIFDVQKEISATRGISPGLSDTSQEEFNAEAWSESGYPFNLRIFC